MLKKFAIIVITTLALVSNSYAGSDGKLLLKKNDPSNVKDCFEGVNRITFAFNKSLDGIIFEPVAKAYRILPSPVRTGTGNMLDNLTNVVTIPNNLLQGDFELAAKNTARFTVNSTVGILGILIQHQK